MRDMRFTSSLEDFFADAGHTRVLRALCWSSPNRLTGRAVARRAGLSVAQTARVLSQLQDQGIAVSEAAGRACLWSWNSEHVWAEGLRAVFRREAALREDLVSDLREAIRGLPAKRVVLFGSVARREEHSDSDVDVFFETPSIGASRKVLDRLAEIQAAISRKYGSAVSPLILTSEEVRRLPRDGVLKSIAQDGVVIGSEAG